MATTSPFANRRVRRQWTAFGVLIVLSMAMMAGSGTGAAHEMQAAFTYAAAPLEKGLNQFADTVSSYWSAFGQIDQLRSQNEQLREENDTLRQQLLRMPAISHLNDDWTAITQTQQFVPYKTTPARVIVRDVTDERPKTIIVDQGSSAGIKKGNVVIAAGGALVGRVQWVSPTISQVLLINDTDSVVIGREEQTGATGDVRGQIGGLLQLANVDASLTLKEGQPIVTAGQSLAQAQIRSPFPPGLLIGTILNVDRDANAVVQSATLLPAADLSKIDYILVITNYEGGLDVTPPSSSASPSASPSPSGSAKPTGRPSATPTPKH